MWLLPRKVLLFRLSHSLTVEVCLARGLLDALLSVTGEFRCCILHVQAVACKDSFVELNVSVSVGVQQVKIQGSSLLGSVSCDCTLLLLFLSIHAEMQDWCS